MMQSRGSQSEQHGHLHPVLILMIIMLLTLVLTHVIPAGRFDRQGGLVIPGSYHTVAKIDGLPAVFAPVPPAATDMPAKAAGVTAFFLDIPAGMIKSAALIFMLMFVGGMFGILRATGAIDAGIDRLLHLTSGNVYLLATGLMVLLACGATFLGFISEYIVIVPIVLAVGQRLGLPNLFAAAVVLVSSMIGWTASVTNPIALTVAQPLAGVPIFSGVVPRLIIFVAMFAFGLAYVLLYLRRLPKLVHIPHSAALTRRQKGVLLAVGLGGTALLAATGLWSWGSGELGAGFIAYGFLLALIGRLAPREAADAFLKGMQSMLVAGLMLGLASAMEIMLQSSQVLDTVVQGFASMIQDHTPAVVVDGMMVGQMVFGLLIHSAMPKAAISIPILAPIAHLSKVSGQQVVTALMVGTGLINMVSPTNGLLLAFLATSKVDYINWLRFITPLFFGLCIIGLIALHLTAVLGY